MAVVRLDCEGELIDQAIRDELAANKCRAEQTKAAADPGAIDLDAFGSVEGAQHFVGAA